MRMTGKKLCPTCKAEKHVLEFSANKRLEDGLSYECRACHNEKQRLRKLARKQSTIIKHRIRRDTKVHLLIDDEA